MEQPAPKTTWIHVTREQVSRPHKGHSVLTLADFKERYSGLPSVIDLIARPDFNAMEIHVGSAIYTFVRFSV